MYSSTSLPFDCLAKPYVGSVERFWLVGTHFHQCWSVFCLSEVSNQFSAASLLHDHLDGYLLLSLLLFVRWAVLSSHLFCSHHEHWVITCSSCVPFFSLTTCYEDGGRKALSLSVLSGYGVGLTSWKQRGRPLKLVLTDCVYCSADSCEWLSGLASFAF